MNHKVIPFLLAASVLICFHPVEEQQPAKVPRIGYLSGTADPKAPGPQDEGFRQGLRDFGYVEGKNILVEYRYAEGKTDHSPGLVAELLQLKVDVLVLPGSGSIRAAKQATKTIPIPILPIINNPVA